MVDHWKYFLMLEKELIDALEYVELSEKNFNTFSNRFNKLLLSIGSEVDVTLKVLCKKFKAPQKESKIGNYRSVILKEKPGFPNIEIEILNFRKIKPWESWREGKNPSWWEDYNNLKHERDTYFEKGNLENVVLSLGGLYVVLLYLYESEVQSLSLRYPPALFNYPGVRPPTFMFAQETTLKLP
jgi:hypothetical protein